MKKQLNTAKSHIAKGRGSRKALSKLTTRTLLLAMAHALGLLAATPVQSQSSEAPEQPAGGQDVLRLSDAAFVPAATGISFPESPAATRLNPALAAGEKDRVLAGTILAAPAAEDSLGGYGATVGGMIPSRLGVVSGTLSVFSLNTSAVSLGTTFSLHAALSRTILGDDSTIFRRDASRRDASRRDGTGPSLAAGIAARLSAGGAGAEASAGEESTGGATGEAEGASVGFTTAYGLYHHIPRLDLPGGRRIHDFGWGVSLTGIGFPYTPVPGGGPVPAGYTLRAEAVADLLRRGALTLSADAAVAAPGFNYATFDLGLALEIGPRVRGRLGSSISTNPIPGLDGTGPRGYLGFSLGITYGPIGDETPRRSPPTSTSAVSRLYDTWLLAAGFRSGLGTIDTRAPTVEIGALRSPVFSPNGDGRLDRMRLPVTVRDDRDLEQYELRVNNSAGELVYRRRHAGTRERRAAETAQERQASITTSLSWNGRGDDGTLLPDGRYSLRIRAWDTAGNMGISEAREVRLDTTPPAAELEVSVVNAPEGADPVFSPNGDGNRDTVLFRHRELSDGRWQAGILDAEGNVRRSWSWPNELPEQLRWNGTDNNGNLVPDGAYRYRLRGEDAAGNSVELLRSGIVKSLQAATVSLAIDRGAFSPNGDGTADTMDLRVEAREASAVESWTIRVLPAAALEPARDAAGNAAARDSASLDSPGSGGSETAEAFIFAEGNGAPPEQRSFSGFDARGARLDDGRYRAHLSVTYRNGNQARAASPVFVVDTQPPRAVVNADTAVFSPNGDGNQDRVTFFHETGRAQHWRGVIRDAEGRPIRTYEWQQAPPASLSWGGTRDSGDPAEPGSYSYRISGTDAAGNTRSSEAVEVRLDMGGASLALSASTRVFSPNADGIQDRLTLVPRISGAADVAEYRLSVYHTGEASDPPIRSIRGEDLPDQLIWDGFSNAGDRVADGSYDLVLTVQFRNGTREESAVRSIRVDTTPPRAEIEAPYRLFSPNGDGRRDRLPIRQEGSTQELWEGRIIGGSGEVLKSWYWKGRPGNFEWDGTDAAGNPLDDGRYRYRLFARDAAGNSSSREISEIRIDTRRPELFVAVTRREISPNGDDYLDDTLIRSFASVRTGIESRRLELRRTAGEGGAQAAEEGSTLRVFTGTDLSSPHETTWNGRDDVGEVVHGTVTPHLEVRYTKGDLVTAEGPGIRVDARPPTTEVEASPLPFSPDGDGTADLLRIDLAASDTGEIAGWEFRILNPSDELFRRFQGRGAPPGSLEWNGRSIDGERVISAETYRYQFEVTDDLGNVAVREGNILIDILQVRENGRLTVEIAPVTFPRGSTELITDPFTERGARNAAVIERFAAMLRQFPDYRVVVEGHAVNESGSRQEEVDEAEPRSQERAEAVRRALIDAGIDADRLSALGRGSSMPIVPDSNIDERRRNRRVEFLLRR